MRERTRVVLALALAGTLVLAGCGGGSTTTTTTGTDTADTTAPATTAAPGYDQSGSALDAETLEANARAVDAYTGTFGVTWTVDGNETQVLDIEIAVDRTEDRGLLDATTRFGGVQRTQTYTAGDTTYVRQNGSGSVAYRVESEPYETLEPVAIEAGATPSGTDGSLVAAFDWERGGTETFDGTTVTRYESVGVANASLLPAAFAGQATVENATATLLVDGDGLVRAYTFEYTLVGQNGRRVEAVQTFTVTAVGETTVDEPGWLDEAQEST